MYYIVCILYKSERESVGILKFDIYLLFEPLFGSLC